MFSVLRRARKSLGKAIFGLSAVVLAACQPSVGAGPAMDPGAAVPVALLVGYGALRLLTSAFTELRELIFAKATQGAARTIALQTFQHLISNWRKRIVQQLDQRGNWLTTYQEVGKK